MGHNISKRDFQIKPLFIKIGSATNLDFPVLEYICKNFKGKVHLFRYDKPKRRGSNSNFRKNE